MLSKRSKSLRRVGLTKFRDLTEENHQFKHVLHIETCRSMTPNRLCTYVVPHEGGEFSITDIAPTLLRYLEKKGSFRQGRLESGVLGTSIRFSSLYDIQTMRGYCGGSLESVIENRLNVDLESFDRIVVFLIDGLNIQSLMGIAGEFVSNVDPEYLFPMFTTFPSMTTVATTSLLTGSFPIAHGVVADTFYDFEEEEVFKVKPYLTEGTKLRLPRMLNITDYFLLSDFWEVDKCSLGFITLGKAHDQLSDRRFLDYFFGEEFSFGGEFTNVDSNHQVYLHAKDFLQRNRDRDFYLLFIRFSIDHFSHLYGSKSTETKNQLGEILTYIVDLNSELNDHSSKKSLVFLLSDHGHKSLDEGFVPVSSLERYLMPEYRLVATNQTILSLYHDDLHIYHPEFKDTVHMIRMRKKGPSFYVFDKKSEKWNLLKSRIENLSPILLRSEDFGLDNRIGDLIVHAENFYFGYREAEYYKEKAPNYINFKSSHGGLSNQEVSCLAFLWSVE